MRCPPPSHLFLPSRQCRMSPLETRPPSSMKMSYSTNLTTSPIAPIRWASPCSAGYSSQISFHAEKQTRRRRKARPHQETKEEKERLDRWQVTQDKIGRMQTKMPRMRVEWVFRCSQAGVKLLNPMPAVEVLHRIRICATQTWEKRRPISWSTQASPYGATSPKQRKRVTKNDVKLINCYFKLGLN